MKTIFATIAALLVSFSSQAEISYSEEIAIETMLRTVISKNLVDGETKKLLTEVLEGSGENERHYLLTGFHCERATGNDYCNLFIYMEDHGGGETTEHSFRLEMVVNEGIISSAFFELIAG